MTNPQILVLGAVAAAVVGVVTYTQAPRILAYRNQRYATWLSKQPVGVRQAVAEKTKLVTTGRGRF